MRVLSFFRPSGRRETGASSVEYALIAACIAAVIVVAVALLGGTSSEHMQKPCDSLAASGSSTTCD